MNKKQWFNDKELLKQFDKEAKRFELGKEKGFTQIEMNQRLEILRKKNSNINKFNRINTK